MKRLGSRCLDHAWRFWLVVHRLPESEKRALLRYVLGWSVLVVVGMVVHPTASSSFIVGWYVGAGVVTFPLCLLR